MTVGIKPNWMRYIRVKCIKPKYIYILANYGQGNALSSRPTSALPAGILVPTSDVFCIFFKPQYPCELVQNIQ